MKNHLAQESNMSNIQAPGVQISIAFQPCTRDDWLRWPAFFWGWVTTNHGLLWPFMRHIMPISTKEMLPRALTTASFRRSFGPSPILETLSFSSWSQLVLVGFRSFTVAVLPRWFAHLQLFRTLNWAQSWVPNSLWQQLWLASHASNASNVTPVDTVVCFSPEGSVLWFLGMTD